MAAFDLDGCLIQSSFPKKGAPPKFEWWRKEVPKKLKQVQEEGCVVLDMRISCYYLCFSF